MRSLILLQCLLLCLAARAQPGRGTIALAVAPKVCLTNNYSGTIGILPVKAGLGFDATVSYGYRPAGTGWTAEIGIGYASFRQSISAAPLQINLPANSLSFQFDYMQALLRAGYAFGLKRERIAVIPMAAFKYFYYLPAAAFHRDWTYADRSNFISDLTYARWNTQLVTYPYASFMLNLSVRFEKAMGPTFIASAAPFFDYGFRTMRATLHTSEFEYDRNKDEAYRVITTNKGDAFGLCLGLAYRL